MTAPLVELSRAQRRVFDALIVDGAPDKTLAARLDLSRDTIRTHLTRVQRATGTHSRAELVTAWYRGAFQLSDPPQAAAGPRLPADQPDTVGPACATSGHPQATWDGTIHGETVQQQRDRLHTARAICARCPLIDPCTRLGADGREIGQWGRHYRADGAPSKGYRILVNGAVNILAAS